MHEGRPENPASATLRFTDTDRMIAPPPLHSAFYRLADDGRFIECEDEWWADEVPKIQRAYPRGYRRRPVIYDSAGARAAAARLLGYANQHTLDGEPGGHIRTPLLEPDARTAIGAIWQLGDGLVLRYTAPFSAELTSERNVWTLTPDLADRWARALLALANELDHGRAVAAQTVI